MAGMEKVKSSGTFSIWKKRSGRFAVLDAANKFVKGEEKVKILLKEKLIKLTAPKAKEAAPAEAQAAAPTA